MNKLEEPKQIQTNLHKFCEFKITISLYQVKIDLVSKNQFGWNKLFFQTNCLIQKYIFIA